MVDWPQAAECTHPWRASQRCHLDRLRRIPRSGSLRRSGEIPRMHPQPRRYEVFYPSCACYPLPCATTSSTVLGVQMNLRGQNLGKIPRFGIVVPPFSGSLHSHSVSRSAGSLVVGRDDKLSYSWTGRVCWYWILPMKCIRECRDPLRGQDRARFHRRLLCHRAGP